MGIADSLSNVLTKFLLAVLSHGKLLLAAGAGVLVVAAGVVLVWWAPWSHGAPDPAGQTPDETVAYMASDDFGKLSADQQDAYMTRLRETRGEEGRRAFFRTDLSDEQRDQLRDNMREVMQRRMRERLDEFFELPEEERDAYLDRILDRFGRPRRPPGGQDGGPPPPEREPTVADDDGNAEGAPDGEGDGDEDRPRRGRRGPTPEGMKRMTENTDPEDRARMGEFMKALRKRAEERGISPRGRRR
jgi:hypothetical protein